MSSELKATLTLSDGSEIKSEFAIDKHEFNESLLQKLTQLQKETNESLTKIVLAEKSANGSAANDTDADMAGEEEEDDDESDAEANDSV